MPERAGTVRLLSTLPGYFWAASVALAAADLITKQFSVPIIVVDGFLRIVHSENRGGVFGLGQGSVAWLVFGVVAGGLVVWFAHRKDAKGLLVQLALGLVLGGAIGNLFDRLSLGYVRDFVDVCYWPGKHWPAFNVADAGICVGAVYLAAHAFWFMPKGKRKEKRR